MGCTSSVSAAGSAHHRTRGKECHDVNFSSAGLESSDTPCDIGVTAVVEELEPATDVETCPICMDNPCDAILPCLHRGCYQCLSRVASGDRGVPKQCPVCRRKIKTGYVTRLQFETRVNCISNCSDIRRGSNVVVVSDGLLRGLHGQVLAVESGHCLVKCGMHTAMWHEPSELASSSMEVVSRVSDVMNLPLPGPLSTEHALAELALVVHTLSVLRLRACRVLNVSTGTRLTNMMLARELLGKSNDLSNLFTTVLNGQPCDSDDAFDLGAQIPILFGRLPSEDRQEVFKLRIERNPCGVRDTAELVLLCLRVILRHVSILQQSQLGIVEARRDILERIDKLASGMWMLDKLTGKFNEKSSDPYCASAAQYVQKIKATLKRRQ